MRNHQVAIDPELAKSPTFQRFEELIANAPPVPRRRHLDQEPFVETVPPPTPEAEVVQYEVEHISADQLPGYNPADW